MVNATDLINNVDLNKGAEWVTYLSKTTTQQIVVWLANKGITVTDRWASFFVLFVALGVIFAGMKISKKIIKWVLIGLGVLLLAGLLIPIW